MALSEIHLMVWKMMERVRRSVSGFYYGTRQQNAARCRVDRIANGEVFLGNERYVYVPISPINAPENRTSSIGCVFHVENGSIYRACFEVVICKSFNDELKKIQAQVMQVISATLSVACSCDADTRRYARCSVEIVRGRQDVVLSETEKKLPKVLQTLLPVLRSYSYPGEQHLHYFTKADMLKCVSRLLRARSNTSLQENEVNARMSKLLNDCCLGDTQK